MSGDPRLDLIHAVEAVMAGDPRIDGLVLIGSGAVGFRDDLSDVDLIAAVAPDLDATAVGDDLARDLQASLALYRYIQTPPARARGIHVFLLEARFRYLAGCGSLWFGLKALQRGELLLATYRLGELRSHVAALASLDRFGTDEQASQRADMLPEAARTMLRGLACGATAHELGQAFRAAMGALSHYDRTLLQGELDDDEYAGLAEWLSLKYLRRSAG